MAIEPALAPDMITRGMAIRAPKKPPPSAAYNIWLAIFLAVLVGKAAEWVPGMTGLPLVKITFILTALFAYRARRAFVPVRVSSLRIARPALAFLTLSIISVFFSIYKSLSLGAVSYTHLDVYKRQAAYRRGRTEPVVGRTPQ